MKKSLTLLLLICLTFCAMPKFSPLAAQQKKSRTVLRLEKQRKKMMKEIEQMNAQLAIASTNTKTSLRKLNLLSQQIETRKELINVLGKEVEEAEKNIVLIGQQIDSLENRFNTHKESYVKSLRAMSLRRNSKDQLLFLLSAEDFAQGLRRLRYLHQYAEWQKHQAEQLKQLQIALESKKKDKLAQFEEQRSLLLSRQKEQDKLQANERAGRNELQRLQSKQKELKELLAQKQRQERALNKKIQDQIAKEIAEAEAKARREAAARRKAEEARRKSLAKKNKAKQPSKADVPETRKAASAGGYAMTKEEWALSSSFSGNRGRLPMPVSGSYRLVGRFGEHPHASLKHVRINNGGIDLESPAGTEARAVFKGTVSRIFVVEGYNNSIILRHGNYLTVYSNLSTVYVKQGDKVSTGQKLGKIYSDPELGGACKLHFQLWKERNKQDPLPWLQR